MNNLMKLKKEYDLDNPQYIEKWFKYQDEAMLYLTEELSLFPKIKELSSAPSSSEKLKDSTIIASDLDSINNVEDGMFIYTTSNDNLYL
jgi:hypothetical protein